MPMTPVLNPYPLPRPYPMVVRLLKARTGITMTPERARQLERAALKKLAKGLREVVEATKGTK